MFYFMIRIAFLGILSFVFIEKLELQAQESRLLVVGTQEEFEKALQSSVPDLCIFLKAGIYEGKTQAYTDPSLGNGEDPSKTAQASVGLFLKGRSLELRGEDRRGVVLRTQGGYGIYIESCPRVLLKDMTITGTFRDGDPQATSGAVVVRGSAVEITGCIIEKNEGDYSQTVAGVGGVMGREGALLHIHHNVIRHNSWDGIALYRGASALIHDNHISYGRGAGIGVTWSAQALIYRNVVEHYWKGIGAFGTSSVHVYNNVLRHLVGWGIIASGQSRVECRWNELSHIGNVGIAGWEETAFIRISENILSYCGEQEQWVAPRVGVWLNAVDSIPLLTRNIFIASHSAEIAFGYQEGGLGVVPFTFQRKLELFEEGQNFKYAQLSEMETHLGKKDRGDPSIRDADGSCSDLGIEGGDYGGWWWDPEKSPFEKRVQ